MDPKCIIWSLISIAKALNLSETKFLKNICDLSIWSKKHTRSSVFEILYSIFLKRNCRHYVKDSPVTMLGSFCSLSRVSKNSDWKFWVVVLLLDLGKSIISSQIWNGSETLKIAPHPQTLQIDEPSLSSPKISKKISTVKSGEPIKLEWIRNV